MIKSFKDKNLEKCWKENDLKRRVLMKLDSMDAATCFEDLKNPPSNNLHQLHGDYETMWAISVNGPWKLVFRLENNDIHDVMLLQYH